MTNNYTGLQDQVWVWLAGDIHKEQYFVKTSVQPQRVWGPEEQAAGLGVTTVTTVNTSWKTLIGAVQEHILDKLALKTGRQLYLLRRQGPVGAADTGPVAQITQVSPLP